jgi:hypothetical protein
MEWAGGNLESFQKGSDAIKRLLNVEITPNGLRRLTVRIGSERESLRDAEVARFQNGELGPQYPQSPGVAVVMLDGGRVQTRAADSRRGVHDPAWAESKVGNLSTYTDVSFTEDPQPEPPSKFLDPPKVLKIIREMKGASGGSKAQEEAPKKKSTPKQTSEPMENQPQPKRKVRTVVATTKNCEEFGPMVAAEAMRRGFFGAQKKAALGDGGLWIWAIVSFYFVGFTPILDFLHLLTHLYAAAQAAYKGEAKKAWKLYEKLVRLAWGGKVTEVLNVLAKHAERIGEAPEKAAGDDPRKILAREREYVKTNAEKMDYARYRREGLPISSAPVESLIKEVNKRVKGTEKFWTKARLEAVLQTRAVYLSDDDRAVRFWSHRPPGRATGRSLFSASRVAA